MEKRYANLALVYAVIAMVFGVFYREFTKIKYFTGQTNLSIIHTHYLCAQKNCLSFRIRIQKRL